MITKKHLGTGYLIGVGVGLFGILTSGVLMPAGANGFSVGTDLLTLLSGLIIVTGFALSGAVLAKGDLTGDRIWRVAQWATVGLGIPTSLIIFLVMFHDQALETVDWQSIATINIAGGGIIGILFGMITELRNEYERTTTLNQRNTVFLRLFRHDIGNSATVLQGYAKQIVAETSSAARSAEIIYEEVEHIVRLSQAARQLDDLESLDETKSVDLTSMIWERVDALRKTHSDAEFEIDMPQTVTVRAGDLLSSAIDNLLRNAIEHNDSDPSIQITVLRTGSNTQSVQLEILDNGPGFPAEELVVHSAQTETPLQHSTGIGLWLTQWIIDSYDGDVSVENADAGGTNVTVKLPSADSPSASIRS